jgi:hypothetical protein
MEQTERTDSFDDSSITTQITSIESAILDLLQRHPGLADPVIDITQLQEQCLGLGISLEDFSHGFVQLLTHRLIEPHGEFRYVLAAEKG